MKCQRCGTDLTKEGGFYITAEGNVCRRCNRMRKTKISMRKRSQKKKQTGNSNGSLKSHRAGNKSPYLPESM